MEEGALSFEQSLENDMKTLALEIQRKREVMETRDASERELVKEAIRAFPQLEKPHPAQAPAPQPSPAPSSSGVLPDYAKDAAPEVKLEIEYLLDLALRQGLQKALAESEKSPYFVQDAFHDALAGKLYPLLQQRGIVE